MRGGGGGRGEEVEEVNSRKLESHLVATNEELLKERFPKCNSLI